MLEPDRLVIPSAHNLNIWGDKPFSGRIPLFHNFIEWTLSGVFQHHSVSLLPAKVAENQKPVMDFLSGQELFPFEAIEKFQSENYLNNRMRSKQGQSHLYSESVKRQPMLNLRCSLFMRTASVSLLVGTCHSSWESRSAFQRWHAPRWISHLSHVYPPHKQTQ